MIRNLEKDLKVAEVIMKEKDAESRLTELKIKELRKQVPASKLKPLAIAYTGM